MRVAVLATEGDVQRELLIVAHIEIARLTATEGVDASVEGPAGLHVDHDLRVGALEGHLVADAVGVAARLQRIGDAAGHRPSSAAGTGTAGDGADRRRKCGQRGRHRGQLGDQ